MQLLFTSLLDGVRLLRKSLAFEQRAQLLLNSPRPTGTGVDTIASPCLSVRSELENLTMRLKKKLHAAASPAMNEDIIVRSRIGSELVQAWRSRRAELVELR